MTYCVFYMLCKPDCCFKITLMAATVTRGMAALGSTSPFCGHDPVRFKLFPCPDFPLHHFLPSAEKDFKLMRQSGVLVILLLPVPYTINALSFLSLLFHTDGQIFPKQILFPPLISFAPKKQQDLPVNQQVHGFTCDSQHQEVAT